MERQERGLDRLIREDPRVNWRETSIRSRPQQPLPPLSDIKSPLLPNSPTSEPVGMDLALPSLLHYLPPGHNAAMSSRRALLLLDPASPTSTAISFPNRRHVVQRGLY